LYSLNTQPGILPIKITLTERTSSSSTPTRNCVYAEVVCPCFVLPSHRLGILPYPEERFSMHTELACLLTSDSPA